MLQNDRVNKRKPAPIQIRVNAIFAGLLGGLCLCIILFYMVVLTVYVKLLENIYEHLFLMSLQTKI